MTKIYELQKEQWAIFFDRGNQLLLQYKEGERIGRPIMLANDYAGGFSAVFYEDALYYLYRNMRGEILLRNNRDNMIYYQLQEGVALHLSAREGNLVIWVFGGREDQENRRLQYICPFRPQESRTIIQELPGQAEVRITETANGNLVVCDTEQGETVYQINQKFEVEKLVTSDRIYSEERENRLRQALEEVERLKGVLEERGQNLQDKDDQLMQMQDMIDSATRQYEELMHVAEQYRDEAIKWRGKFTF